MQLLNYEHICHQTIELTKAVGAFIREQKNNITDEVIETKGLHNYVTYVDKTAEQKLVDGLSKILPESGFIAEEGTSDKKGDVYNWIIDPLDGTTNYIHGLPPFAISIALMENDKAVVGIVYEICLDECFYTWKDAKAYMNGKVIKVSGAKTVKDSLVATGFPYFDYSKLEPFIKSLAYFMKNSHGMRRIGSAATDLAYVACGRFDAFYEYSLSPWDVAAGAFLVEQAGGKVSDFGGGTDYIFGKEIVSTNANIFNEFLNVVKTYLD